MHTHRSSTRDIYANIHTDRHITVSRMCHVYVHTCRKKETWATYTYISVSSLVTTGAYYFECVRGCTRRIDKRSQVVRSYIPQYYICMAPSCKVRYFRFEWATAIASKLHGWHIQRLDTSVRRGRLPRPEISLCWDIWRTLNFSTGFKCTSNHRIGPSYLSRDIWTTFKKKARSGAILMYLKCQKFSAVPNFLTTS